MVRQVAAVFDENLVAAVVSAGGIDPIADFALQTHVGDDALHRLGIDPRKVAGVGVAVGIAIGNVEQEDEIMPLGRVAVDRAESLQKSFAMGEMVWWMNDAIQGRRRSWRRPVVACGRWRRQVCARWW